MDSARPKRRSPMRRPTAARPGRRRRYTEPANLAVRATTNCRWIAVSGRFGNRSGTFAGAHWPAAEYSESRSRCCLRLCARRRAQPVTGGPRQSMLLGMSRPVFDLCRVEWLSRPLLADRVVVGDDVADGDGLIAVRAGCPRAQASGEEVAVGTTSFAQVASFAFGADCRRCRPAPLGGEWAVPRVGFSRPFVCRRPSSTAAVRRARTRCRTGRSS